MIVDATCAPSNIRYPQDVSLLNEARENLENLKPRGRDECERVEVEPKFRLAKRKCGMGLVTAKLWETAAHEIAMSVLVLNLRRIQCAF